MALVDELNDKLEGISTKLSELTKTTECLCSILADTQQKLEIIEKKMGCEFIPPKVKLPRYEQILALIKGCGEALNSLENGDE